MDQVMDAPGRRVVLSAALVAPALLAAKPGKAAQGKSAPAASLFAYVGTFTTAQRKARGEGISVYRVDPATGGWTHVQTLGEQVNPSFLHLSRDQRFLYAVHGDGDYATSYAVDPASGRVREAQPRRDRREERRTPSDRPHRPLDGRGEYGSGTVAVLPVKPDGTLADQQQLVELPGKPGPHKVEQAISHPHDVVFDPSGRFVVIPDKGLDRIFVFSLDAASGRLTPAGNDGFTQARAGAGPRHMAFHPKLPVAWVLNELDSTTTTCRWDAKAGTLAPVQTITTLPTDFNGDSTCAEISVSADGRFVHCSNRGHDSVTTYAADPRTGVLSAVRWTPTQGKGPRFIGLSPDGRFLQAANEQGDNIVAFRVDAKTGKLTPTGQNLACKSPVCIVYAGAGTLPRA
ncbi:lactonase family protein [Dankookia sp. P2]|uniref:lactonase family protein n=1 Tax=Dankookia sp. P2 TaxID=3423955 RepID=UPI003D677A1E